MGEKTPTTWTKAMGDVSQVCEEFNGLNNAHEVVPESIQDIIEAMVSRQPLHTETHSQSHIMWLARETTKMLNRHAELVKREICVARREAALAGRASS